ncbi:SH3 domain-containing protein [Clostridium sp. NSJ-49]|uniref:C40 family peptidase n=1 Tax=Clostridium TaxID=1485 RepID=UPI00164AF079|nr:SH3 domain-containing protein [Clostridium sp. NSJ-49]MBC5627190.1 SH3 domain-containing protein [Clostridium sp. NSJ-49]
MNKSTIKRGIAISGVIGGMVLLKPIAVQALENNELPTTEADIENVNMRSTSRGQVVNVDGTYLRIRSNPSTNSEILGTMSEGISFEIISYSNGWYKISYNSILGYVHGDYVEEINSSSTEDTLYYGKVYNAEPNLRVRSGASLNSSIIGYVVDNTTVTIVGTADEWYKIKFNNGYGYVHSDYILVNGINDGNNNNNENGAGGDDTVRKIGYVYDLGGSTLRIRKSPNTNSEVLGSLYEGNSVNIIGEEGNWYRISYNNSVAYVSKDYITLEKTSDDNNSGSGEILPEQSIISKGKVINVEGSNLRVRKEASTDSFVIGYLLNNTIVEIQGQVGNWYKISFKDSVGYVSADYITVDFEENSGNIGNEGSVNKEAYNIILDSMKAQLGAPYVWGGSGEFLTTEFLNELKIRFPEDAAQGEYDHAERFVDMGYRAFDCSGLIYWAFRQVGINVGRTTYNQINDGVEVSLNDVIPGDLIFTGDLGHVGMYIGDGKWIESSFTGDTVRISNVPWGYVSRARRIL